MNNTDTYSAFKVSNIQSNMKDQKTFKVFIVEDDLWYSSMLEYYLSLNPDYVIQKFDTAKM